MPVVGASLSYLVDRLSRRGFLFWKMNEVDAVWVHSSVAATVLEADKDLSFPVDEWACWLQTPFYVGDGRLKFPSSFTREWALEEDAFRALKFMWSNLTHA